MSHLFARFFANLVVVSLVVAGLLFGGVANAAPTLLMDAETGQVIYAEQQDHPWHPASITKLMTAYLVFEAIKKGRLKLSDAVLQSERSIKEPPSKIGYPVGIGMSIELALQSLIIKSANDVAVSLAEKVGGTVEGFAARMNRKARALGMKNTNFVNPNGLHHIDHVSTARDLAFLARAVWRDFPEHQHRFSRYHMRIGRRRLHSYNSLLRTFAGTDGMKTGFVCASGYNIAASASRNGRRLIAVVLGSRSPSKRSARTSALLSYGFKYYDWKTLLGTKLGTLDLTSLPRGEDEKATPGNMRPIVCRPHRRVVRKRRSNRKKKRSRRRKKRSN